jgi:hypothetical protein
MKHMIGCIAMLSSLASFAPTSSAQSRSVESKEIGSELGFFEVAGVYGFQFGEQDYLPDGSPAERKHPYTNGFGFNATAGYSLMSGLDIIIDYAYASARSRTGSITGVLDGVSGSIDYQTIDAGLRSGRKIGRGRLYGELAVGVVLPFETQLEYDYGALMNAAGITGTGTRTDSYNLGFGAHGELGYQLPLWQDLYLGTSLRVQGFQSNNDGEKTRLDNFVTDFGMPQPTTATIRYATSSGEAPRTYSVQDLRLHLDVGYRF